jgi:hypothetical protein
MAPKRGRPISHTDDLVILERRKKNAERQRQYHNRKKAAQAVNTPVTTEQLQQGDSQLGAYWMVPKWTKPSQQPVPAVVAHPLSQVETAIHNDGQSDIVTDGGSDTSVQSHQSQSRKERKRSKRRPKPNTLENLPGEVFCLPPRQDWTTQYRRHGGLSSGYAKNSGLGCHCSGRWQR